MSPYLTRTKMCKHKLKKEKRKIHHGNRKCRKICRKKKELDSELHKKGNNKFKNKYLPFNNALILWVISKRCNPRMFIQWQIGREISELSWLF